MSETKEVTIVEDGVVLRGLVNITPQPLVKGGCGHSSQDVFESTNIVVGSIILGIVILAMLLV